MEQDPGGSCLVAYLRVPLLIRVPSVLCRKLLLLLLSRVLLLVGRLHVPVGSVDI
jgi:hypothetical protein